MLELITKAINLLDEVSPKLSKTQLQELQDLKVSIDNYRTSYFDNFNFD